MKFSNSNNSSLAMVIIGRGKTLLFFYEIDIAMQGYSRVVIGESLGNNWFNEDLKMNIKASGDREWLHC